MRFTPHDAATAKALEWLERHANEQSGGGWISREDAMRLVALVELLAAPRRDHFAVSVFDPSYEHLTPKTRWTDVWERLELTPLEPEPEQAALDLRPAFQSDMDHVMPPPTDLKAVMTTAPGWTEDDHRRWFPWRYAKEAPSVDHASHRHYAPDERRPPRNVGLYGEPRGDDLAMPELDEAIKRGDVS